MKLLAVIPARAGSKRIPHKNTRLLVGKPLIAYSIELASAVFGPENVVVSSDSDRVLKIAERLGVHTVTRPASLATDGVTLDPVVFHAVKEMEKQVGRVYDAVVTLQPTSPLLSQKSLTSAFEKFKAIREVNDTLIAVKNENHLAWVMREGKAVPDYKERVNSQLLPPRFVETGAFVFSNRSVVTSSSRIARPAVFEVSKDESIDIDTMQDWWVAEKLLLRKRIVIRVSGSHMNGLGHVKRGLILAKRISDHEVFLAVDESEPLALEVVAASNFQYFTFSSEDTFVEELKRRGIHLVINDILNTPREYIGRIQEMGAKVVNFEDLGEGTALADRVINALYEKRMDGEHLFWGTQYLCLSDELSYLANREFHRDVRKIFVCFGATDPSNQTTRLLSILKDLLPPSVTVHVVVGAGFAGLSGLVDLINQCRFEVVLHHNISHIEYVMAGSELAFAAGGNTAFELAALRVPTLSISHNAREAERKNLYDEIGIMHLGLAEEISDQDLSQKVRKVVEDSDLRFEIFSRMKSRNLHGGLERVAEIIEKVFTEAM